MTSKEVCLLHIYIVHTKVLAVAPVAGTIGLKLVVVDRACESPRNGMLGIRKCSTA